MAAITPDDTLRYLAAFLQEWVPAKRAELDAAAARMAGKGSKPKVENAKVAGDVAPIVQTGGRATDEKMNVTGDVVPAIEPEFPDVGLDEALPDGETDAVEIPAPTKNPEVDSWL